MNKLSKEQKDTVRQMIRHLTDGTDFVYIQARHVGHARMVQLAKRCAFKNVVNVDNNKKCDFESYTFHVTNPVNELSNENSAMAMWMPAQLTDSKKEIKRHTK